MLIDPVRLHAVQLETLRSSVQASEWFYAKPGEEHYKLLAYLSTLINGGTIFDIGTHHGDSAHALSFNAANHVYSFDINDRVPAHRRTRTNIEYQLCDLFDPRTRGAWATKILGSALIFIDVDPHEGHHEFEFVSWLQANNYQGVIVLDDIWYFKPMRNNLWYRIEGRYRTDLTALGHWSGTGIVSFKQPIEIKGQTTKTDNWTLVTGYFDLTVKPDANAAIRARPASLYLDEHAASVLTLDQNVIVFCEPHNVAKVLSIRPTYLHSKTRIVQMSFEDFPLTTHRDRIIKNRGGTGACPTDPRNTASYYLFCVARFAMLKRAMQDNPFVSTHFAWVNICIERMGYKNLIHLPEALRQQRDKFSTCYIDYVPKQTTQNLADNFCGARCVGRCTMCSGFFTGNAKYMRAVCDKVEAQFLRCLQAGYGHADEQLINLVYFEDPTLFDWYLGDYQQMVTNYAGVYEEPGAPIRNLIQHSYEAGDWDVCGKACDILLRSHETGKCTLIPEALAALTRTREAAARRRA